MVRRDLSNPLVPTLAAAVLGAAYLLAAPETADMAAHTYRTWLLHQVGFATWNAQWYGGHHMAGYSLLYPPLAAVAGTRHQASLHRRGPEPVAGPGEADAGVGRIHARV